MIIYEISLLLRDICRPSSEMTLPTKSNSEYPNLYIDALKNKLCNLNRSKIERKRETNSTSVLDFPVPVYAKQLKSFRGTVNYFRDFIRNQSSLVHLLHALRKTDFVYNHENNLQFLENFLTV